MKAEKRRDGGELWFGKGRASSFERLDARCSLRPSEDENSPSHTRPHTFLRPESLQPDSRPRPIDEHHTTRTRRIVRPSCIPNITQPILEWYAPLRSPICHRPHLDRLAHTRSLPSITTTACPLNFVLLVSLSHSTSRSPPRLEI